LVLVVIEYFISLSKLLDSEAAVPKMIPAENPNQQAYIGGSNKWILWVRFYETVLKRVGILSFIAWVITWMYIQKMKGFTRSKPPAELNFSMITTIRQLDF